MIDQDGFRLNVGAILFNDKKELFWARRIRHKGWQFPQGGLHEGETPEAALFRELYEEIGLTEADVAVEACTPEWLPYRLPEHLIRRHQTPICYGQKQKWFLLRLMSQENQICLTRTDTPEFDSWRWVNYWYPLKHIIEFKRQVYQQVLQDFSGILSIPPPDKSAC